jgi:hypothetical protein
MNKSAEHAQFTKDQWKELIKYPWQTYSNQDLRRQYKMYSILGSAALPYEKFQKVKDTCKILTSQYRNT